MFLPSTGYFFLSLSIYRVQLEYVVKEISSRVLCFPADPARSEFFCSRRSSEIDQPLLFSNRIVLANMHLPQGNIQN